jgi:hypothetical protein
MKHSPTHILYLLLPILQTIVHSSTAYIVSPSSSVQNHRDLTTNLPMIQTGNGGGGGLFGQDGIWNGLFGNNKSGNENPRTVVEIPAKDLKIGALRFLLQIHLVGEQNKPLPKTWVTRQGNDNGNLQVYYQDGTGMLSIQFQEYGLLIQRCGERPSLQYQLQESVLLHRVLDELDNVAFGVADDNIDENKRLLVLKDSNAIDLARTKLPARQV